MYQAGREWFGDWEGKEEWMETHGNCVDWAVWLGDFISPKPAFNRKRGFHWDAYFPFPLMEQKVSVSQNIF